MRTLAIACLCFMAGALTALTLVDSSSAQVRPQAIPVVPNVSLTPLIGNIHNMGGKVVLDGFSSTGDTFNPGSVLEYGGGLFALNNVKVSPQTRIHLTGAALNTSQLLVALGLIGCPVVQPHGHAMPNYAVPQPFQGNLASMPVGQ